MSGGNADRGMESTRGKKERVSLSLFFFLTFGRYQRPAAAVIPALVVYIKVAAVKKLVVGFRNVEVKVRLNGVARCPLPIFG